MLGDSEKKERKETRNGEERPALLLRITTDELCPPTTKKKATAAKQDRYKRRTHTERRGQPTDAHLPLSRYHGRCWW